MKRGTQYSLMTLLLTLTIVLGACTEKKEEEAPSEDYDAPAYPVYPEVNLDCSSVSDAVSADPNAASKPTAMVIEFKISESMNSYIGNRHSSWPTSLGPPICTPLAIKEKINRIFHLYGSDPNYDVRFVYKGTYDTAKYRSQIPADGTLYINMTHGAPTDPTPDSDLIMGNTGYLFGNWGPPNSRRNSSGVWPTSYPGGLATAGPMSYDYSTLIHEIGHTLGLVHENGHSAVSNSMSYGIISTDPTEEHLAYGLQDRVNLAALKPVAGYVTMSISGLVTSSPAIVGPGGYGGTDRVYMHAVNVVNGLTYFSSAYEIDGNSTGLWKFKINIGSPGTYKVFATTNNKNTEQDPTSQVASWAVGSSSTKDPAAASSYVLSTGAPTVTGLQIPMIMEAAPFFLRQIRHHPGGLSPSPGHATFLLQGESVTTGMDLYTTEGVNRNQPLASLQIFGTSPDVTIGPITTGAIAGTYNFNVTAGASAVPGPRLLVGRAASGNAVYGLIGIEVLPSGASKPSYVMTPLQNQIAEEFDFTTLNPNYWKP